MTLLCCLGTLWLDRGGEGGGLVLLLWCPTGSLVWSVSYSQFASFASLPCFSFSFFSDL